MLFIASGASLTFGMFLLGERHIEILTILLADVLGQWLFVVIALPCLTFSWLLMMMTTATTLNTMTTINAWSSEIRLTLGVMFLRAFLLRMNFFSFLITTLQIRSSKTFILQLLPELCFRGFFVASPEEITMRRSFRNRFFSMSFAWLHFSTTSTEL